VFAGLILNFLFFNFALIYKSRSIEKEKTVLQIQKQTELFNQRTEIGNDLHDDIGATLSGLHVYSTIVESEIDRNPDLAKKYLNKITIGIRTVMDNMNDVIWAVNIREKNPKLFSSRLKDFNMEIFDAKNIECIYEIDTELERKITRMIARKNLILITKEAINNVVKHSRATKVFIRLKTNGDSLILEIEDNGIGMTSHKNKSGGNGLHSLQIRTAQLGGVLSIHNHHHGGGLLVQTSIPLANISD
jgi:signal transduction histidine kinase